MATSGFLSGTVSANSSYYRAILYWVRMGFSIENNTSTIRIFSLIDRQPNPSWSISWYENSPGCANYALTVDGQSGNIGNFLTRTDTGYTYDAASSPTGYKAELIPEVVVSSNLSTGGQEFTIPHNADGTKSVNISHSYFIDNTYSPKSVSISGTITLDSIPRASQPTLSASSIPMGDAVTVYTNRVSGSFTHTIEYAFGSATGTIATGVADSISWTLPKALANQIPNTTSGTGTITCHTYNGGILIGSKTVGFTATVPDTAEFRPSFSSVTHVELTTSPAVATIVGKYVQNLSNIRLIVAGAAGAYGSSISSYTISYNSSNYGSSQIDTGFIAWSGNSNVVATITDSRGRTFSNISSPLVLNALSYSVPTISAFTIQRCLSNGTIDPLGTYAKVVRSGSASSLLNGTEKNTIAAKVYYKDRAGVSPANFTEITNMTVAATATLTAVGSTPIVSTSAIALATKSYDFKLEIVDKFYTTASLQVLGTGAAIMSWSNTGVGIGKIHQSGALDVAGQANFSGQIASSVAAGTAPLVVASNTLVANLNADKLDGNDAAAFAAAAHTHTGYLATSGGSLSGALTLPYVTVTAQDGTSEGGEIHLNGAGGNSGIDIDNYQGNFRVIIAGVEICRINTAGSIVLGSGAGKGLYVNDELTGTQWHLHMHGDSLKYFNGSAEYEVIDTRNKGWYTPNMGVGGINLDISGSNIHNDYSTGFYMGASVTNAYTADWYYFLIQRHNGSYKTVISIPLSASGLIRWKACRNGTWGGWYQINA